MILARYNNYVVSDGTITDGSEEKPAHIVVSELPEGYSDITSVENWHLFGYDALDDYQDVQKAIRLAGYDKGWSACTNTEKDIIVEYYANPQINQTGSTQNVEVITHLMMTRGMSQDESIDYIVDMWWNHWTKFLADCDGRWRSAVKVAIKHLSFADAGDLFDEIEILVGYYLSSGRLGRDYGDSRDGIMDYIMSTNVYIGNGLEENSYALKKGTWDSFRSELEDALVSEYFWDDIKLYIENLK